MLLVGAHPDDEDTELLTLLARGEGAEAAYLALNRGEGGQNLIGAELGTALGVLRTEELQAARRLDGARQYFTRAFDFGFSKTQDDTWAHWPHDSLLKDVVRIVRRFRPQVIVAVFSGTPRDGHGQHQAAGVLAREAFRVAGDPAAFPELARDEGLAPWTAARLYRSARFDSAATTLVLDGGRVDRAAGRTYHQLAMASRSLHRSQDMGQLQGLGPSAVRLALVEDRTGAGGGLWDGVDTTLAAVPGAPTGRGDAFAKYAALVAAVQRGEVPPARLSAQLAEADAAFRAAALPQDAPDARAALPPELADQLAALDRARLAASGVLLDAWTARGTVAQGDTVTLTLAAYNASEAPVEVDLAPELDAGLGTLEGGAAPALRVAPGARVERRWLLRVAPSAAPSTPYYLRVPLRGAMYDWGEVPAGLRGLPAAPPPVRARFVVRGTGAPVAAAREVAWRYSDQARGEVREPLVVAPPVGVRLDPQAAAWRAAPGARHRFTVTLRHAATDTARGRVRLLVPDGWRAGPAQPFTLAGPGEEASFRIVVTPGAGAAGTVRAVAELDDGRRFDAGQVTIAYPHVRPVTVTAPATAPVRVLALTWPALGRVGYVRGAADRVPEALADAGLPVELLDGAAIATGDLDRYAAIVVGPRAWETEPALAEWNARLLAYVRRGGFLLVQYQQYGYFTGGFAPYPLFIASRLPGSEANVVTSRAAPNAPFGTALLGGHDRVTDETAPVTVLHPGDPVVTRPNRLGPADWDGWVQERGLYFARAWDPHWRTALELHDPGEAPLEGGLLVAGVGRGRYAYTGLAFFRQLPAGVPGAFRLFANLLALAPRR